MHVSGLAEMTEEMGNSFGKQQPSADGGGHLLCSKCDFSSKDMTTVCDSSPIYSM